MLDVNAITRTMIEWLEADSEYFLNDCWDVECTWLAEAYANDVLDIDGAIPDEVFDAAVYAAEHWEEVIRVKGD